MTRITLQIAFLVLALLRNTIFASAAVNRRLDVVTPYPVVATPATAGTIASLGLTVTTGSSWPSDAILTVDFPIDYVSNVTDYATSVNINDGGGQWLPSKSGRRVTLSRTSGSAIAVGSPVQFAIAGVPNPSRSGRTSSFAVNIYQNDATSLVESLTILGPSIYAAKLQDVVIQLSSSAAGTPTTLTLSVKTSNEIPALGSLQLLAHGLTLNTLSITSSSPQTLQSVSLTTSQNAVFLQLANGVAKSTNVQVSIAGFQTPLKSGSAGPISIMTITDTGLPIDDFYTPSGLNITPGQLSSPQISFSSALSSFFSIPVTTVSFTTSCSLEIGSKVVISLPSTSLTIPGSISLSTSSPSLSIPSSSASVITLILTSSLSPSSPISVGLGGIQVRAMSGALGDVTIETQTPSGVTIDSAIISGPAIQTGEIFFVAVGLYSSAAAGSPSSVGLNFTTTSPLFSGSQIVVIFPVGFGVEIPRITSSNPTFIASSAALVSSTVSSDALSLTVTVQSALSGGANVSLTFDGLRNPSYAGITGGFQVKTYASNGIPVDESALGSPVAISAGIFGATAAVLNPTTAGATANLSIDISLGNNLPKSGSMLIILPAPFSFSESNMPTLGSCSGIDGHWTITTAFDPSNSVVITLTRTGDGTLARGSSRVRLSINGLMNPPTSGTPPSLQALTRTADAKIIDQSTFPFSADIAPGQIILSSLISNTNAIVGSQSLSLNISLTVVNPLPAAGKIIILFPAQFTPPLSNSLSFTTALEDGITAVLGYNSQSVILSRPGTGVLLPANSQIKLSLSSLNSPAAAGDIGQFRFLTTTSAGVIIDQATVAPSFTVSPGPLRNLYIASDSYIMGDVTSLIISFVTLNAVPATGGFAVLIPAAYGDLSSIGLTGCLGLDGNLSIDVFGRRLQITRAAGGSTLAAGSVVTARLSGFQVPIMTSESDPFIVSTVDVTGRIIDQAIYSSTSSLGSRAGVLTSRETIATYLGGPANSYQMRLSTAPTSNVALTIAALPTQYFDISPSLLIFSSANWSSDQTITITPRIDATVPLSGVVGSISVNSAVSSDLNYNSVTNVSAQPVLFALQPSIKAGILISSGAKVLPYESSLTYTIELLKAPTSDVTIQVTVRASASLQASPGQLTFTSSNWNSQQAVTLTALTWDASLLSPQQELVVHAVVSAGTEYANADFFPSNNLTAVVYNPALSYIILSRTDLYCWEAVKNDSYTISLSSKPSAPVRVSLSVPNAQRTIFTTPSVLSFNSVNWYQPQQVLVQTVNVSALVTDVKLGITHTIVSADPRYDSDAAIVVPHSDMRVHILEWEYATARLNVSELRLWEGSSIGYSIALVQRPGQDVTVSVTSSSSRLSVLESSVVFTPLNYATPQTIIVSAPSDDVAHQQTEIVSIFHALQSTDPLFHNGPIEPTGQLSVELYDDDLPGILLVRNYVSVEQGNTVSYWISLTTRPSSLVRIYATPAIPDNASYLVTMAPEMPLIFLPENWSVAQEVQVAAATEATGLGDHYQVVLSHRAVSSDYAYNSTNASFLPPSRLVNVTVYSSQPSCQRSCSAGYYNTIADGVEVCRACPHGAYCAGFCSAPTLCPVGTASNNTGATGISACISCFSGYYTSYQGSAQCLPCPPGMSCPDPAALPQGCARGTYSTGQAASCSQCSPGTYNVLVNQTNCIPCPAGYACSDPAASPLLCASGSYPGVNFTSCEACPQGFSCSASAIGPVPCPAGQYALFNFGYCVSCPPGSFCSNTAASPQDCPVGTFSTGGVTLCTNCPSGTYSNTTRATSCKPCPAGYSCSAPTVSPIACAAGTYSPSNAISCPSCPNGTYSRAASSACTACGVGLYSRAGATACSSCPGGFFCPSADADPILCAAGTYSIGSSTSCRICPAGTYCTDGASATRACPTGSTSGAGSSSCQLCAPGFACPAVDQSPIACPAGYYSLGNATSCSLCPAGYYCTSTSQTPVTCQSGRYSPAGSVSCAACPAGYSCANADQAPILCQPGTFSIQGQPDCTPCPAGAACPYTTNNTIISCQPGYYATGSSTSCTPCPVGKQCPSIFTATIQICTPGQYSAGAQATCSVCQAGSACPNIDGSGIFQCLVGSFSVAGSTSCTTCPAGFACPYTSQNVMVICPPGTFSVEGQAFCRPCPAGHYCPDTTKDSQLPCPIGYFAVGNQTNCTACPAGFNCLSQITDDKQMCQSGEFSLQGDSYCQACPAGFYCSDKTASPVPCDAGTYSLGQSTTCLSCPAGFQCGQANIAPQQCPVGYYSAGRAATCTACDPGFRCPAGSTTKTPPGSECPEGSYCNPAYTITRCPAGMYGNTTAGVSVSQACTTCLAGYFCNAGSTAASMLSSPCPQGYFCPIGTASVSQNPCPAGRYSSSIGATSSSTCLLCPDGSYCPAGSQNPNLQCPAGYYCPAGNLNGFDNPCPPGSYSSQLGMSRVSQCQSCPPGAFCPQGSSSPLPCAPGSYNPSVNMSSPCPACIAGYACPSSGMTEMTTPCSPGYYCPTGTSSPTQYPCPAGTFTNSTNLVAAQQCTPCPAGKACRQGTGGNQLPELCSAGFYCPQGTQFPTQYSCPGGSFGTLTSLVQAIDCTPCPPGSYCVGGQTQVSGNCGRGYYCPQNTSFATQFACPAGTYNDQMGKASLTDCLACPAGSYCPVAATGPISCPLGTYSALNGTTNAGPGNWPSCTRCSEGSFCPVGSVIQLACGPGSYSRDGAGSCTQCPAGIYCSAARNGYTSFITGGGTWERNSDPTGKCFSGVYCPAGQDRIPTRANNACPTGYYCPAGTETPVACPAGTYNALTGMSTIGDCTPCPAGSYCLQSSSAITGPCRAGFYCPVQSTGADQIPCPARTYRATPGGATLDDCTICPAGKQCTAGTSTPAPCVRGFYCVTGSEVGESCPLGTYGNSTGLRDVTDCTLCPPGYYCSGLGSSQPTDLCDPGYYCALGSYTSAPGAGGTQIAMLGSISVGGRCPAGGFCPRGSSAPLSCPSGTYNNLTGGQSSQDCTSCPPGYYCGGSSQPIPTGPCAAGYYCIGGSANATQYMTPPGYYSPGGSSYPLPCAPGTFTSTAASSTCMPCTAGFQCPATNLTQPQACPRGTYCPQGTVLAIACPPGTYGTLPLSSSVSDCQACPPGKYCATAGLIDPTGDCDAGYYCVSQSSSRAPASGSSAGGRCPPGSYCPQGAATPIPCPVGTYGPNLGSQTVSLCLNCPPGRYCNVSGLSAPTGSCNAGYYCVSGASIPSPTEIVSVNGVQTGGNRCPSGSYCLAGASQPTPCASGNYIDVDGRDSCLSCPPGSYCPAGTANVRGTPCPAGYYCPAGTSDFLQFPCPRGSYSNVTGLSSSAQCLPAPSGQFVATEGARVPTGLCAAGYYCINGSVSARPTDSGQGGQCTPGEFCPDGSGWPQPCTPGKYCVNTTASGDPTGDCSAGYFCAQGSSTPTPSGETNSRGLIGNICPRGYYCLSGSVSPTACPAGTFSNTTGNQIAAACQLCTSGFLCPSAGTTLPFTPCPAGFYCDEGQSTATTPCPVGNYCPLGTGIPIACAGGTYQRRTGQSSCLTCPGGYYCPLSTVFPVPCPPGYYCPEASSTYLQSPCPAGTYSNSTQLVRAIECTPCDTGMYCATTALLAPTAVCSPGYFCSLGSSVSTPAPNTTNPYDGNLCLTPFNVTSTSWGRVIPGDLCPVGHYCPAGTKGPVPCPAGTASNARGNTQVSDCLDCPSGFLCPSAGTAVSTTLCTPGYYCPPGKAVAQEFCPAGSKCPAGSSVPQPCPRGYYQGQTASADCFQCPAGGFCVENTTTPAPCPPGYYCPAGSTTGTSYPCPSGTYSNLTSLKDSSECIACPSGWYCGEPGQTAPSGRCATGYYCTSSAVSPTPASDSTGGVCWGGHVCVLGASQPNPTDGATGFACRQGRYCPNGTTTEIPCPAGSYTSTTGQSRCTTCPSGSYCVEGATLPGECPVGSYCINGIPVPSLCPNGTHGSRANLTSVAECTACGGGNYCANGVIAGNCSPGFFCAANNFQPTPQGIGTASSFVMMDGGVCPPGHFCTTGTARPIPCPDATIRLAPGGASLNDCSPCPVGLKCSRGDPIAQPCPRGYYCTLGAIPQPCPNTTYSNALSVGSRDGCVTCPAGTFCNSQGITDPTIYHCPAGFFCPEGASAPVPCPAGTYSSQVDGTSISSCLPCSGGRYCPSGTILPIVCPGGSYAPQGSPECRGCPAGSYCDAASFSPFNCPPGHYCPSNTTMPITCPLGTFCPEQSGYPILCPAGSKGMVYPRRGSRNSSYDACESCPPGTVGADTLRLKCLACPEGYVCIGGTTTLYPNDQRADGGYPCPPGAFCGENSTYPTLCRPGTYNNKARATNSSYCLDCPANFYSFREGDTSCLPCSSSSTSIPGSTKCNCKGAYRSFQMSDGLCICSPGYEFYDENWVSHSDEDGDVDCQPKVYDRCPNGYGRSSSGICVETSSICTIQCSSGSGTFNTRLGICDCANQPILDNICDQTCRDNAVTVTFDSITGTLALYDPATNSTTKLKQSELPGFSGTLQCPQSVLTAGGSCSVKTLSLSGDGITGQYGTSITASTNKTTQRRRLAESAGAAVPDPVLCLNLGDSIYFDLGSGSEKHYPVYMKDSMLNTNPNFDYGDFRDLGRKIDSGLDVKAFGFSFNQNGTYVFGMSNNGKTQSVIVVMERGMSCPDPGSSIMPLTSANLVKLSATRSSDIVLTPDWSLILGLLGGLFGVIAIIIGGLYYFRRAAWMAAEAEIEDYKLKAKQVDFTKLHGAGAIVKKGKETIMEMENAGVGLTNEATGPGAAEPGGFIEALRQQNLLTSQAIESHSTAISGVQEIMKSEATEIKQLIQAMLSEGGKHIHEARDYLLRQLKTDILSRRKYQDRIEEAITEILAVLEEAQMLFEPSASAAAKKILQESSEDLDGVYNRGEQDSPDRGKSATLNRLRELLSRLKIHGVSSYGFSPLGGNWGASAATLSSCERVRKLAADTLWEAGMLAQPMELHTELSQLRAILKQKDVVVDTCIEEALGHAKTIGEGIPLILSQLSKKHSEYCTAAREAKDKKNPDTEGQAVEVSAEALRQLLQDIVDALRKTQEKLAASRQNVPASVQDASDTQADALKKLEQWLSALVAKQQELHHQLSLPHSEGAPPPVQLKIPLAPLPLLPPSPKTPSAREEKPPTGEDMAIFSAPKEARESARSELQSALEATDISEEIRAQVEKDLETEKAAIEAKLREELAISQEIMNRLTGDQQPNPDKARRKSFAIQAKAEALEAELRRTEEELHSLDVAGHPLASIPQGIINAKAAISDITDSTMASVASDNANGNKFISERGNPMNISTLPQEDPETELAPLYEHLRKDELALQNAVERETARIMLKHKGIEGGENDSEDAGHTISLTQPIKYRGNLIGEKLASLKRLEHNISTRYHAKTSQAIAEANRQCLSSIDKQIQKLQDDRMGLKESLRKSKESENEPEEKKDARRVQEERKAIMVASLQELIACSDGETSEVSPLIYEKLNQQQTSKLIALDELLRARQHKQVAEATLRQLDVQLKETENTLLAEVKNHQQNFETKKVNLQKSLLEDIFAYHQQLKEAEAAMEAVSVEKIGRLEEQLRQSRENNPPTAADSASRKQEEENARRAVIQDLQSDQAAILLNSPLQKTEDSLFQKLELLEDIKKDESAALSADCTQLLMVETQLAREKAKIVVAIQEAETALQQANASFMAKETLIAQEHSLYLAMLKSLEEVHKNPLLTDEEQEEKCSAIQRETAERVQDLHEEMKRNLEDNAASIAKEIDEDHKRNVESAKEKAQATVRALVGVRSAVLEEFGKLRGDHVRTLQEVEEERAKVLDQLEESYRERQERTERGTPQYVQLMSDRKAEEFEILKPLESREMALISARKEAESALMRSQASIIAAHEAASAHAEAYAMALAASSAAEGALAEATNILKDIQERHYSDSAKLRKSLELEKERQSSLLRERLRAAREEKMKRLSTASSQENKDLFDTEKAVVETEMQDLENAENLKITAMLKQLEHKAEEKEREALLQETMEAAETAQFSMVDSLSKAEAERAKVEAEANRVLEMLEHELTVKQNALREKHQQESLRLQERIREKRRKQLSQTQESGSSALDQEAAERALLIEEKDTQLKLEAELQKSLDRLTKEVVQSHAQSLADSSAALSSAKVGAAALSASATALATELGGSQFKQEAISAIRRLESEHQRAVDQLAIDNAEKQTVSRSQLLARVQQRKKDRALRVSEDGDARGLRDEEIEKNKKDMEEELTKQADEDLKALRKALASELSYSQQAESKRHLEALEAAASEAEQSAFKRAQDAQEDLCGAEKKRMLMSERHSAELEALKAQLAQERAKTINNLEESFLDKRDEELHAIESNASLRADEKNKEKTKLEIKIQNEREESLNALLEAEKTRLDELRKSHLAEAISLGETLAASRVNAQATIAACDGQLNAFSHKIAENRYKEALERVHKEGESSLRELEESIAQEAHRQEDLLRKRLKKQRLKKAKEVEASLFGEDENKRSTELAAALKEIDADEAIQIEKLREQVQEQAQERYKEESAKMKKLEADAQDKLLREAQRQAAQKETELRLAQDELQRLSDRHEKETSEFFIQWDSKMKEEFLKAEEEARLNNALAMEEAKKKNPSISPLELRHLEQDFLTQRKVEHQNLISRLINERRHKSEETLQRQAKERSEATKKEVCARIRATASATEATVLAAATIQQTQDPFSLTQIVPSSSLPSAVANPDGKFGDSKAREQQEETAARIVQGVRSAHAEAEKKLKESFELEKQIKEEKLTQRLAKEREKRLAKLAEAKASDEEKKRVEQELQEMEGREREDLRKRLAEEEEKKLREHQLKTADEEKGALAERAKQMEEKAVAAEIEKKNADDVVKKMKEEHTEQLKSMEESLEVQKQQESIKLEERIRAKRAAKQREMEEKQLAHGEIEKEQAQLAQAEEEMRKKFAENAEKEKQSALEAERQRLLKEETEAVEKAAQAKVAAASAAVIAKAQADILTLETQRLQEEFHVDGKRSGEAMAAAAEANSQKLEQRLAQKRKLLQKQRESVLQKLEEAQESERLQGDAAATAGAANGNAVMPLPGSEALSPEAAALVAVTTGSVAAEGATADGTSATPAAAQAKLKAAEEASLAELRLLEEEQKRVREELDKKHEEEKQKAIKEAAAALQSELEMQLKRQEEENRAILDRKRQELEKKIMDEASSSQSLEAVKSHYEQELAQQAKFLEAESQKKKDDLKKRIDAKKKKKEQEILDKQAKEKAKTVEDQLNAKSQLQTQFDYEREATALKETLSNPSDMTSEKLNSAVEGVMQKRHHRETSELLSKQANEKANALRECLGALLEKKAVARAALLSQLMSKDSTASDDDKQKALQALDESFREQQMKTELEATANLEQKHAEEQLELRQKQLLEVASAVKVVAPEETLKKTDIEQAIRAEEDLRHFKEQMLQAKEARVAAIRKQKEDFETELKRKAEEELARLEADHMAQLDAERKAAEDRINLQREKLLQEKKSQAEKEIAALGEVGEQHKKLIVQQFEDHHKVTMDELERERERQQSQLQKRLEKKRQTKMINQKMKLETDLALNRQREERSIQAVEQSATKAMEKVPEVVAQRLSRPEILGKWSKALQGTSTGQQKRRSSLVSQDTSSSLNAVPPSQVSSKETELVISKISALEDMVKRLTSALPAVSTAQPAPVPDSRELGGSAEKKLVQAMIAAHPGVAKDAARPAEGVLTAIPLSSLDERRRMRFDHGKNLLRRFGVADNLELVPASTLPEIRTQHETFRNSFYFDKATRTIYVRPERMDNVGEFTMMLVHAIAQAQIDPDGQMSDIDPAYVTAVQQLLSRSYQELFSIANSTTQISSVSVVPTVSATSLPRSTSFTPTSLSGTEKERSDLKDEALKLSDLSATTGAAQPTISRYQPQRMADRISKMQSFLQSLDQVAISEMGQNSAEDDPLSLLST